MKFKRFLQLREQSFLLIGPRGTGKSTLIRDQIKFALELDLLQSKIFLPLKANPSLLEKWDKRWNEPLIDIKQKSKEQINKIIGIYCGKEILEQDELTIYPVEVFFNLLSKGNFF